MNFGLRFHPFLILFQSRFHFFLHKLQNLIGGSSDKCFGVEKHVNLIFDRLEVRRPSDPVRQVVSTSLLFDLSRCLVGQHADPLVTLALTSGSDR